MDKGSWLFLGNVHYISGQKFIFEETGREVQKNILDLRTHFDARKRDSGNFYERIIFGWVFFLYILMSTESLCMFTDSGVCSCRLEHCRLAGVL